MAASDVEGDGPEVVLRPPEAGDLGWIVERHGVLYDAERGWDRRFEALVARVVADVVDDHDPRRDAVWIAEVDGRRAGTITCVHDPDDPARSKLRLMLVEPWARGRGVGGRLVAACVAFARDSGAERMTLWTVQVLEPAIRLYRAAGFVLVAEEPGPDLEPGLVSQTYELVL